MTTKKAAPSKTPYDFEILFSREQIEERIREIAEQITKDYAGESIVLIGVLKGAALISGGSGAGNRC